MEAAVTTILRDAGPSAATICKIRKSRTKVSDEVQQRVLARVRPTPCMSPQSAFSGLMRGRGQHYSVTATAPANLAAYRHDAVSLLVDVSGASLAHDVLPAADRDLLVGFDKHMLRR